MINIKNRNTLLEGNDFLKSSLWGGFRRISCSRII
jgi:hypothetical protein